MDPIDVDVDSSGNLFVADFDNYRVRKLTSAGILSTVAGNGGIGGITGGTTTALTANVQVGSGVSLGDHTLTLVTPGGNVDFTFNVTLAPLDLTISEAYPTKKSP